MEKIRHEVQLKSIGSLHEFAGILLGLSSVVMLIQMFKTHYTRQSFFHATTILY